MRVLLMISMILTICSSALFTLVFENKKIYRAFCIFFGICFAQVVLTFEILSLFSGIYPKNILLLNVVFYILSGLLWLKNKPKFDFSKEAKEEFCKFKTALRRDKWLKWVFFAFLICIFGSLIYAYMMPAIDEDAFSYHIARLPFWFDMHNINHFTISDSRAGIMPINSEIFYFWAYSFTKSLLFVRFLSVISSILFVCALRGFLKFLKISMKRSIWAVFAVFAMHNVLLSFSGAETNITIAALMLATVYLFGVGVKENKIKYYYFASLLYALAIGTKTPALQAAPALFLIVCILIYCYGNKKFLKPIFLCTLFTVLNFVIFGSYNYVLNFLDYGNPIASVQSYELHKFVGGYQAFIANMIRYSARFIDFSGLPLSIVPWRIVTALTDVFIAILGISPDICEITPETNFFELGNNFENMSGFGVLGFLVFIPSVIVAIKNIRNSKRAMVLGSMALGFLLNVVILSCTLGYMIFSIRFLMFFVLLSSPIVVYMFLKQDKFRKLLAVIMIYMFTFSYYFYERRFSPYLIYTFIKNPSIKEFKDNALCANVDLCDDSQACSWVKMVKKDAGQKNVLYFSSTGTNIFYPKHSETDDFKVDFALLETSDENNIDWDKYNYILIPNLQESTVIKDIQKYRNLVESYTFDENNVPQYSYKSGYFSYCYYSSFRTKTYDDWVNTNANNFTTSFCYHNPFIIEKHGYKLVAKFNDYDKKHDKVLNLYKKIRQD